MAMTESPQYCQENRARQVKTAEMAVLVSTASLDLPAKTEETERMVFRVNAAPTASLAPKVSPVKTARTARAGLWALQATVVSMARTARMGAMVSTATLVCRVVTAAMAVMAMTVQTGLLVPRATRATLVPRVLLVLPALVAPRETRVTRVRKALAALKGRRDPEAKPALTARTDLRARGVFPVLTAKMVHAALRAPRETRAGTAPLGPRATRAAPARKDLSALKATEEHLVKMVATENKARGVCQDLPVPLALLELEVRQDLLEWTAKTEKMARLAPWVAWALLDPSVHEVLLAHEDSPGPQDPLVPRALLVPRGITGPKVTKATEDLLVQSVSLVMLVPKVPVAIQGSLAALVPLELRVSPALKALAVSSVPEVSPAPRVAMATLELQANLARSVQRAPPALPVFPAPSVPLAKLAPSDLKAPPEPVEQLVLVALSVQVDLLVLLDPLGHPVTVALSAPAVFPVLLGQLVLKVHVVKSALVDTPHQPPT